jgi:hypothetical protein
MVGVRYLTQSSEYRLNLRKVNNSNPSEFLALSEIGHPCARFIWYNFHFVSKKAFITASLQRLFDTGELLENVLVKNLESTGNLVLERQKVIWGDSGYSKGRIDGKSIGFPEYDEMLLVEFKSANDKNYREFKKIGCKKKDQKIYAQVQRYLGAENLSVCVLIIINKNSSKIYLEFIEFNQNYFENLLVKEEKIICSVAPLEKAYTDGSKECKYCDHALVCHKNMPADKNCRTCKNSGMVGDGVWNCDYHNKDLIYNEQRKGCSQWVKGWGL